MRHNNVGRKLGRTASHRKATLAALSTALIKHKKIQTTKAKAKETRRIIEPIITRARNAYMREQSGQPVDVHARREIAKFIHDKEAVQTLFAEIAEKVGQRPGGYTRVLKLGRRLGDGAEMAVIELVDYNTAQDDKRRKARVSGQKKADDRKKRLEGQKKSTAPATAATAVDVAPEDNAPVAEAEVVESHELVVDEQAPVQEVPAADASSDDAPATDETPAEGEEKKAE